MSSVSFCIDTQECDDDDDDDDDVSNVFSITLVQQITLNTTIPMRLSCRCYGE